MRKRTRNLLPKLERLLIDTDVKPTLLTYLKAVGFDVMWARNAKVNIRSDRALVAFARHYHRILICHDRHKDKSRDKETRVQISQEIYEDGGQVIEITGKPSQEVLTSLGKILTHRQKWKEFFESNDGIVVVYENRDPVTNPRKELMQRVQYMFNHESIPVVHLKAPRKESKQRKKVVIRKPEEKTFDDIMPSADQDSSG